LQLSIIIVNYNVQYYIEHCLHSVLAACKNIQAEVFVIDNASTDNSKQYLHNTFTQVHFIWKASNEGFAKANNQALKLATGNLILFLNPDTIVAEDCFEKCIAFCNNTNNIGAIGVRMIDGNGTYLPESKRGFPSPFTAFCKLTGLTTLFSTSTIFSRYYLGHLPNNSTNPIDVIAGAFMMVPKNVLAAVGSFDEQFFMYGEDIDLSYRIKKAGYDNYFFANTTIIHFKGESTQKLNNKYIQYFYGAMRLFVKKHYHNSMGTLFSLFLHTAISLKAMQATIKNIFKKQIITEGYIPFIATKIAVVADEKVYAAIQNSLLDNVYKLSKTTADNVDDTFDAIVFSTTKLTCKNIIYLMQQQHSYTYILLHIANATSIIGSNNKNKKGMAICFK
jgi:GT2 family glycosyltransferase